MEGARDEFHCKAHMYAVDGEHAYLSGIFQISNFPRIGFHDAADHGVDNT